MKTLFATLALGLSVSTAALAEPFTMGSQHYPPAARSNPMADSASSTADSGGFNERDTGYRRDDAAASKASRAEMTDAAIPAHRPQGWSGPGAWNS